MSVKAPRKGCFMVGGRRFHFEYESDRDTLDSAFHRALPWASRYITETSFFSWKKKRLTWDFLLPKKLKNPLVLHKNDDEFEWFTFWTAEPITTRHRETIVRHACFPSPALQNNVYIRPIYRQLWKRIVYPYLKNSPECRVLHITGTPGVGKTMFMYYLLCKLRRRKKRVIITLGRMSYILDAHPRIIEDLRPYEVDKETVFLYDPDEIQERCEQRIRGTNHYIIISSPDKIHTRHAKKCNIRKVTMPTWSWSEVARCNYLLYNKLECQVREAFVKYGQTARTCFVFDLATLETDLKEALASDKISDIVIQIYRPEGDALRGEMERYMQIRPNGRRDWATPFIKRKFYKALRPMYLSFEYRDRLIKAQHYLALGDVYEDYVKNVIYNHSRDIRVMPYSTNDPNDPNSFTFRTKLEVMHVIEHLDELQKGKVYVPIVRNFPAVDLIVSPNLLIQITMAKTHKIKGLSDVIDLLPKRDTWRFVFIIPPKNLGKFEITSGIRFCRNCNISLYTAIIDFPEDEPNNQEEAKIDSEEDESEEENEEESEAEESDSDEESEQEGHLQSEGVRNNKRSRNAISEPVVDEQGEQKANPKKRVKRETVS